MTRDQDEAYKAVEATLKEASTWPWFKDLKSRITELLQKNEHLSLKEAYDITVDGAGTIAGIVRSEDAPHWATGTITTTGMPISATCCPLWTR